MARPRHTAERWRNGRIKRKRTSPPILDRGNEYAVRQRASLVGNGDARDPRAGYPLGILVLQGSLSICQHDAGLRYALLSTIVWGGSRTPPSCLKHLMPTLADADRAPSEAHQRDQWRARKRGELESAVAALRTLPTSRPFRVLEDVAVYEMRPRFLQNGVRRQTPGARSAATLDQQALTAALTCLVELWGMRE